MDSDESLLKQALKHIRVVDTRPIGGGNPYYECPICERTEIEGCDEDCRNREAMELKEKIEQRLKNNKE